MKKITIFILVLAAVGAGYYFYDKNNKYALAPAEKEAVVADQKANDEAKPADQAANNPQATPPAKSQETTAGVDTEVSGRFSTGEDLGSPDILVVEVGYDGQKFNPDTVSIKAGDIVIFRNNSGQDFWPASGPHPTHTAYAEFDAKAAVAPKGKFQFKFEKAGQWAFHDHLNPSATGVVNVSAK
jgi:plastocyanin